MNWFTRLFRRKRKPEPEPVIRFRAGGDIIARQGGQKRNRVHVYRQPFGQPFGRPIRLCDWTGVDVKSIELVGKVEGISGPAELPALDLGLDWAEGKRNAVICKHCRALVQGKRGPVVGGPGGPA